MMPEGFYLNPILDDKSLEEIYNVGDYPHLDYAYVDGEDLKTVERNETSSSTEDISQENNFTSEITDTNETTGVTPTFIDEDFNGTRSTDWTSDSNDTFSVDFNESTPYDEASDSTVDTNYTTVADEDFITVSSSEGTAAQTQASDEHSVPSTLETDTESSVTTTLIEESTENSTEQVTSASGDGNSSVNSVNVPVIPLAKQGCADRCFEQVCTTTTQDASENCCRLILLGYFRT